MYKILFVAFLFFAHEGAAAPVIRDTVPSGVPQLFGGKYYKFNGYVLVDSFLMTAAGDTNAIPYFPSLEFKSSDNRWYGYDRSRWQKFLFPSDTTSLSNRINLKLNISDTGAMLSPYLRKIDTASLSNRINLKLNISDTSDMLSPYLRKIDTAAMLSPYVNLAGYGIIKTGQMIRVDTGATGVATQHDLSAQLNSNIGTAYRWLQPSSQEIKTFNPGYGVLADSTTLSNTITAKIDTLTVDARYPKIYNVVSGFGAKPDGKERFDGAMTSGSPILTCVSCNFTANDVGKAIRVDGAVTGGDLVTTIAGFTNSSTVTLSANATRTVTNDTLIFGTDNTAFIQRAIDSASINGDAEVYIPAGIYVLAGPLVTSYEGANPNSQLVWQVAKFGDSTFNRRKYFSIRGVQKINDNPSTLREDYPTALYGTVLYSIINGSGTLPAVFGTRANGGAFGDINYNMPTFKNLTIILPRNRYAGGPSIGGINGYYSSSTPMENISVGISGSIYKQPEPTNDIAAIVVGKNSSEIYTSLKNVTTFATKYGFIVSEDVSVDHCIAHAHIYGWTFIADSYPVAASFMAAHWCQYSINIPNSTLFGFIPSGTSYLSIQQLSVEVYDGSSMGAPAWLNYQYVINDPGNNGSGTIHDYVVGQAECCTNMSKFNKNGGTNIYCHQSGTHLAQEFNGWLTVDKTNKRLGLADGPISPTSTIQVSKNLAGFIDLAIYNTNSAGQAGNQVVNNLSQTLGTRVLGSTATGYGAWATGGSALYGNAAGGMHIFQDHNSSITFSTGAGTPAPKRMEITGVGAVNIIGDQQDQFTITGNNIGRTSINIRNTNASGNTSLLVDNDRGSLAAHTGILTGGQSFASSFFGVSSADKTMIYHGGASGTGLLFGTLTSTPIIIGTNNAERMRLSSGGELQIGSTTDQGAFTLQNTGGLYQNGTFSLRGTLTGDNTMNILVKGTDSVVYQIPQTIVASGTYTPTLTAVANISASTAYQCQYMRVGNVVTVSGKVDIDPTSGSNTLTQLGISLPIASGVPNDFECGGVGHSSASHELGGAIRADTVNDRAELIFTTQTVITNQSWFFTFTYLIDNS